MRPSPQFLLIMPLFKDERSINSSERKIVRHNIFSINLAAFAFNVVQIAAFWVDVVQVQSWVEPALNRKAVKKQAVRVVLGLSIKRSERDSSSDGSTLLIIMPLFKDERSINSGKCKVIRRCLYRSSPPPFIDEPKILLAQHFLTVLRFKNKIFRIHLAALATIFTGRATF